MQTIEFETNILNGMVQIPMTYRNILFSKKAKVIITIEDEVENIESNQSDFIESLTRRPRHIDATISFLSRESANER